MAAVQQRVMGEGRQVERAGAQALAGELGLRRLVRDAAEEALFRVNRSRSGGPFVPPAAALQQPGPELSGGSGLDRTPVEGEEGVRAFLEHLLVAGPGQAGVLAQLLGHVQKKVREAPGVQIMERVDHRLLEPDDFVARTRLRDVGAPVLEIHPVGQDQVRHDAGLVQEGREADDEQVAGTGDGVLQSEGGGQAVDRVRLMQQQQLGGAGPQAIDFGSPLGQGGRFSGRRRLIQGAVGIEPDATLGAHASHQVVEGVDGLQVEQAVCVGPRRSSADGQAGAPTGELPGQAADGVDASLVSDDLGEENLVGNDLGPEGFECRCSLAAGQGPDVHAICLQALGDDDVG